MRFVRVPLPDPHWAVSGSGSMSADGSRLAFSVGQQPANVHPSDGVRIYDARAHELRFLRPAHGAIISGDGAYLYFAGRGRRAPLSYYERLGLDSGARRHLPADVNTPPFGFFNGVIDHAGERLVFLLFTPGRGFDPDVQTAHIYEFADESIRRVPGALPHYIHEVALSRDGTTVAFTSADALDPTAPPPNEYLQAFIYRVGDDAVRQVTGREDMGGAFQPRLSADGRILSYRGNLESDLHVVDVETGKELYHFDPGVLGEYYLSDDGNVLAFTSTADLDPTVGNPGHWNQLFRLDRRTGGIEQLTDVASTFGFFGAMDAAARTFFFGIGGEIEVDGLRLLLPGARVVERREPNRKPAIVAPASVSGREGAPIYIPLAASDPDSDPLTFFAELDTSPELSILRMAPYLPDITDADGDGQAELTLYPNFGHAGHHRLHVAVFDGGGGAAAQAVDLYIAEVAAAEIDLNCDHRFDAADAGIVTHFIYNDFLGNAPFGRQCRDADRNDDGIVSAADLTALLRLYAPAAPDAAEG